MARMQGVDRRKSYVRIADELRRDIAEGRFAVGEPLPSGAELAERFGHSKMTVGNALGVLREEGLISTQQGSRSVVIATPDTATPAEPEHSEEFDLISAQLKEMRTAIRQLGSRLDELDERTRHLGDD